MKSDITKNEGAFRSHKSYSPEEIIAAGGATAFGIKTGKNNSTLIKALEEAAPIEPFSEEEWTDLLDQLEKDK